MLALSAIATLVSVICFPLAFLTLLYPHVASRFGRWRGFLLYLGLSLGTLLLAAWSAPDSETSLADWTWIDWSVASVLGGELVAILFGTIEGNFYRPSRLGRVGPILKNLELERSDLGHRILPKR